MLRHKIYTVHLLITIMCCQVSYSQEFVRLLPKYKKNQKVSLSQNTAKKNYRSKNYKKCLKQLHKLGKTISDKAIIHNKANCLFKQKNYDIAKKLYLKLITSKYRYKKDAMFYYGYCQKMNIEYKKAIQIFTKCLSYKYKSKYRVKRIKKHIKECKRGLFFRSKKSDVKITNLGPKINSKFKDIIPLVNADQTKIIFTSMRPTSLNQETSRDNVYISEYKQNWTKPKIIKFPSKRKLHLAKVGFSYDGKDIYIYKPRNKGDIYKTSYVDKKWNKPVPLGGLINSPYKESSISVSNDKKTIYIVSTRKSEKLKNYGRQDIFVITKDKKGEYTEIKNIGPTINTKLDEEGVCIHSDNRTLYFSSKGHNTIGGFDIYKSIRNKEGEWSKPKNMGHPINTPDNDVFLSVAANGKTAYLSARRADSFGEEDIYKVSLNTLIERKVNKETGISENVTNQPQTASLTLLKGRVLNKNGKPIKALFNIIDLKTNETLFDYETDKNTGEYMVTLPSGQTYGILVTCKGFLHYSSNIEMKIDDGYNELNHDIELSKISKGAKTTLSNIFFDNNKYLLKKESFSELDLIIDLLKKNPKTEAIIRGHTDNVGSADYNLNLSEKRAKSMFDYITKHIGSNRLKHVGFGASKPIATNKTVEGRQKNRRVELYISKN